MIPLGQLVPELLLAFGGALFVGNLAALVRFRREARAAGGERTPGEVDTDEARPRATVGGGSRPRILMNLAIGLVVTIFAAGTLISQR